MDGGIWKLSGKVGFGSCEFEGGIRKLRVLKWDSEAESWKVGFRSWISEDYECDTHYQ